MTSRNDARAAASSGPSGWASGSTCWAAWTVSIHHNARAGRSRAAAMATPTDMTSPALPPPAARSSIEPRVAR